MNSETPRVPALSLNTATVREQWNLAQMIEACARHGIPGISPWRDKLAELGATRAAAMIRANGLTVTGLCRGGMFPAATAAGRQAAIEDNLRAIDDAATLGAKCLVLVCGGLPPGSRDLEGARAMVRDGIASILGHARAAGVPLAIEPLHPMYAADRCCINTLAQALSLCDEIDPHRTPIREGAQSAVLGVAVDAYHVWWDPELDRSLERAGADRMLAYHICDWLVETRDLLLDRGMLGDGVIDLRALGRRVRAAGYQGFDEVEILSRHWWSVDPDVVIGTICERHPACVT